jgi:hypothetical protein
MYADRWVGSRLRAGQLRHHEIQLGIPAGRFIMQNSANRRVRMTRVCKDIQITADATS